MNHRPLFLLLILFIFPACGHKSDIEKMEITTERVLKVLRSGSLQEFKDLIGVELVNMGKDDKLLERDFDSCRSLINIFAAERKISYKITNEYQIAGMRKVLVPLYQGVDTLGGIKRADIELYFGPPQYVSLNKISGYSIVVENSRNSFPVIAPQLNPNYKK